MRLQELKNTLETVLPLLRVTINPITINGTDYVQISDYEDLKKAIDILSLSGLFNNEVRYLASSSIAEFSGVKNLNVGSGTGYEIRNYVASIRAKVIDFIALLNDSLPIASQESIFIKFGKINDLKDLAAEAENFNKILEQTILEPEIGGSIQVQSVDNGSIWIEIVLGTSEAVALIGAISYAAAFLFREHQKSLILAETRKTKVLTNERLAQLNAANEVLLTELVDTEAEKINDDFFSTPDNERTERLKNSIRMLSDEFGKGAEIQASLTAPTEVQNFFPNLKNLLTLLPRTKELDEGEK